MPYCFGFLFKICCSPHCCFVFLFPGGHPDVVLASQFLQLNPGKTSHDFLPPVLPISSLLSTKLVASIPGNTYKDYKELNMIRLASAQSLTLQDNALIGLTHRVDIEQFRLLQAVAGKGLCCIAGIETLQASSIYVVLVHYTDVHVRIFWLSYLDTRWDFIRKGSQGRKGILRHYLHMVWDIFELRT